MIRTISIDTHPSEYMLSATRKETTSAAGRSYQQYDDIVQKVSVHPHTRSLSFTHYYSRNSLLVHLL